MSRLLFAVTLLWASMLWASMLDARSISDKDIANDSETADWLAYGRTHIEQRFSPLGDIHQANVADLKPDWMLDLPDDIGLVSTPLVIDGVLYFTGTMNVVRAVNATGSSASAS